MKKTLYIFSVATALLLAACAPDERNNYMVDDTISLIFDEQAAEVSVYSGSFEVTVQKAGKGRSGASVSLGVASAAIADFNSENDTEYKEIPASMYALSASSLDFEQSDIRKSFTVDWDVARLCDLLDDDNYVIPVSISGASIDVNSDRSFLLLNLVKSTVELASNGSTVLAKENADEDGSVSVKIKLNRPVGMDLAVSCAIDNSLVETYNAERGASCIEAPASYVQLPSEIVIPKGAEDVYADITLNTSVLFGADGRMMDFRTMVVPIKITGTSVDGLLVSDKVYYLVVNSPFAGAVFSRIWGKYSIDKLWTGEYADIPDGGDRNIAVDGKYVYLPYAVGGSTAKITAISVDDPSVTKQVNTTGFVPATITSACVRVIDKGDGSTMLVASGAGENNFPFYAWENGIDNPPTVFSLECTWRRGGDRFEFHGSWKDGILYVHAYQGRFATRYKVENGKFVSTDDGRFNGTKRALVDMTAADTGFGGFYAYPGQDQMVFTTSDVSAFVSMKGTYNDPGDGQKAWETAREAFPDADMTWGYRVFSLSGDKYIAYTAIDKNDDVKDDGVTAYTTKQRARLVVVEDKGGFKTSLGGDNRNILFEAPLQGEEFTDFALAPPTSAQGDCAVYVSGKQVIIAALVQGIGIGVFKLE